MAQILVEIGVRIAAEIVAAGIGAVATHALASKSQKKRSNSINAKRGSSKKPIKQDRAFLVESSDADFGFACERLVNIAFETSQSFPSIIGTYGEFVEYIKTELAKQYSGELFHVIIGDKRFAFDVSSANFHAEISQQTYHVIIFNTKRNPCVKMENSDVNSQTALLWS